MNVLNVVEKLYLEFATTRRASDYTIYMMAKKHGTTSTQMRVLINVGREVHAAKAVTNLEQAS